MNHLYTIEKAIFYIGNSEFMQLSKQISSTVHVTTEVVEAFKSTFSTHPIVRIVMLCYNGDLWMGLSLLDLNTEACVVYTNYTKH